jgi:hypothetical protein
MKLRIGIDPGTKTGFAVADSDTGRLLEVQTLDFWSTFDRINFLAASPDYEVVEIVIEVPDTKHVWHKGASGPAALQRQGVNVGSVIREAQLLAEGLARQFPVTRVKPRGKHPADKFADYTGWTERTNQHERDAALLVYRRPRGC